MDNDITMLKARTQLIPLKEISELFGASTKKILRIESKFIRKIDGKLSKRGTDHDLDPKTLALYNDLKIKRSKGLI